MQSYETDDSFCDSMELVPMSEVPLWREEDSVLNSRDELQYFKDINVSTTDDEQRMASQKDEPQENDNANAEGLDDSFDLPIEWATPLHSQENNERSTVRKQMFDEVSSSMRILDAPTSGGWGVKTMCKRNDMPCLSFSQQWMQYDDEQRGMWLAEEVNRVRSQPLPDTLYGSNWINPIDTNRNGLKRQLLQADWDGQELDDDYIEEDDEFLPHLPWKRSRFAENSTTNELEISLPPQDMSD